MAAQPDVAKARPLFRCSFCMKPQDKVAKLISGPGVMICNECVDLCVPIMAAATSPAPEQMITPASMPTDGLLQLLAGYNTAFEGIDATMQSLVDILRERDVSWAAIGETLGVSRQAAWKRFG